MKTIQYKIIQLINACGPLSQVDIANKLSISLPTVVTNVNHLVKERLLVQNHGESTGGRKPVIVGLNNTSCYVFGIDFRVDTLAVTLFDFGLNPVVEQILSTDNYVSVEKLMNQLFENMKDILLNNNIQIKKLIGVGISVPGIINEESHDLVIAPKIHIRNESLMKYNYFLNVPIHFENEANAGCYGEWKLGAARNYHNVVYFSIMGGFGAGIVINDSLYRGTKYMAGEIGHIIVKRNGRMCSCGQRGCLTEYLDDTSFLKGYKEKTGRTLETREAFWDLVKERDPVALDVANDYIDDLVFAMQLTILVLDPDIIVIGGYNLKSSFPKMVEKLNKSKSTLFSDENNVVCSQLDGNASIIGVALYVRNDYLLKRNKDELHDTPLKTIPI
ncbi:ROK family transcriptional regulator [uncultured Sphaerochaeta sp.]|uniref:ROK family transcriptional regulator n=1 Tax=uncultured Sphaerochaeta sp. TaxID=886478 RepID=UPI002A0A58CE|nr:ROK family transcriptional regulator [uncultured Sphaerochaeta sp.]